LTVITLQLVLKGVVTSTGTNFTYSWTSLTGSFDGPTDEINATATTEGTYILTVTDTDTSCIGTEFINVTINNSLPNVAINNDQIINCNNTTATLDGTGSDTTDVTYEWTTGNGSFTGSTTGITATATTAGLYTLTVTNTINGCRDSKTVSVTEDNILPNIVGPTEVCEDDTIKLIATIATTITYTWSSSDNSIATIDSSGLVTGISNGTVVISYTNSKGCEATYSVNILEIPTATITQDCEEANYTLSAFEPNNNYTYNWYDASGNLVNEGTSAVITMPGTYELQVNNGICSVSETMTVSNILCVVQKGISPNGDGYNDTWNLSNYDVKKVQIFNRYGTEVYTKQNYTNEWGGTSDGSELPSATYYYMITFNNNTTKTGWVYINR
jgi:gliding motility-associated-like protein